MAFLGRFVGGLLGLVLAGVGYTLACFVLSPFLSRPDASDPMERNAAQLPWLWGFYGVLWTCVILATDKVAEHLPEELQPEQIHRTTMGILGMFWLFDLAVWFLSYLTTRSAAFPCEGAH
jgi:hypothetical protein